MGGPPSTPRTPARKGRKGKGARDLNATNMAESYFEAQSAKVCPFSIIHSWFYFNQSLKSIISQLNKKAIK